MLLCIVAERGAKKKAKKEGGILCWVLYAVAE